MACIPIGLLTAYPPNQVPGLRYRIEQYLSWLREQGYDLSFLSFFRTAELQEFYRPTTSPVKKAFYLARGIWRQVGHLRKYASTYRGIYLYREATLLGWTYVERAWASRVPLLLDFDDAIWLPAVSEANRAFAWLKNPKKLHTLLRLARVVTVCNDFLADYARQFATDVRIIPTTLDTDLYTPCPKPPRDTVVIGWSGSLTTLAHFRLVERVLARLKRRYGERIRFKVIGAPTYASPDLGIQGLPWRADTEVEDLQDIDIGLMPLPEDEWSRGKCALKALQYMALGIPPVVSPVGMNRQVVQDGINGFLARSEEDWIDKLSFLIEHPEERQRLGTAARKTVEAHYSVRANAPKYLDAFQTAFGIPTFGS